MAGKTEQKDVPRRRPRRKTWQDKALWLLLVVSTSTHYASFQRTTSEPINKIAALGCQDHDQIRVKVYQFVKSRTRQSQYVQVAVRGQIMNRWRRNYSTDQY